jgi:hypothetical protein
MADGWRKIDRGLFESPDGRWRIANPWRLNTELRHRWLVAQRRSDGAGWNMHDGDHATPQDARAYVARLGDAASAVRRPAHEREHR